MKINELLWTSRIYPISVRSLDPMKVSEKLYFKTFHLHRRLCPIPILIPNQIHISATANPASAAAKKW